jgi:hypothetical protein
MTNHTRLSGRTAAEESAADERAEVDKQLSPELPEERERKFQRGLSGRPKMEWAPEQQLNIKAIHDTVDLRLLNTFGDVYRVLNELYEVIRDPVMANGQPLRDAQGRVQYRTDGSGLPIEDWGRLTMKERERFLYLITTRLVFWEQKAAETWLESMYGKVEFEQAYATGFRDLDPAMKDTEGTRAASGKIAARDDQYLAVIMTYYSKKAEALVRSMERLSQRLKDIHVAS